MLAMGLDDPRERGLAGELLAARWLRRRGWRILARRLFTSGGEVDLVGLDGDVLVCVEVKTGRAGPRWSPGMRVTARDVERRTRAARDLARRLGRRHHRVDLVEVCLPLDPGRPRVLRVQDLRRPLRRSSGAPE